MQVSSIKNFHLKKYIKKLYKLYLEISESFKFQV